MEETVKRVRVKSGKVGGIFERLGMINMSKTQQMPLGESFGIKCFDDSSERNGGYHWYSKKLTTKT